MVYMINELNQNLIENLLRVRVDSVSAGLTIKLQKRSPRQLLLLLIGVYERHAFFVMSFIYKEGR
jgi:hypothetical protein